MLTFNYGWGTSATDTIIDVLGATDKRIVTAIEAADKRYHGQPIPKFIKLWAELIFDVGSKTMKLRVWRALKKTSWPADRSPVSRTANTASGYHAPYYSPWDYAFPPNTPTQVTEDL